MVRQLLNKLVRGKSPLLRAQKLQPIIEALQAGATVLDVGVKSQMPEPNPSENWLEKQDPGKGKIIAISLDDMSAFRRKYPHVCSVQADGSALPFRDGSVDIAAANAVLEHVWPEKQAPFVHELTRVAKRWAWLAVPDRWCPVEVHTRYPLIHWLPFWRQVFRSRGQTYWAEPTGLNLFTKRSLGKLASKAAFGQGRWHITRQTLWGVPISLLARYDHGARIRTTHRD